MQIGLSAWSLRARMARRSPSLMDFPAFAAQHDFAGVELMDRQMVHWTEHELSAFRERCEQAGVGLILDVSSDLTPADESAWQAQMAYVARMLHVARRLGAQKMRICLGGQSISLVNLFRRLGFRKSQGKGSIAYSREGLVKKWLLSPRLGYLAHQLRRRGGARVNNESAKMARAIAAVRQLVPEAAAAGIPLVVENHWGISSDPQNLLKVVEAADSDYVGACPDFTNFPRKIDPYDGLAMLAPKARHVHAKGARFDPRGEERNLDYRLCLQILKRAGYDDTITVEYEGLGDPLEGSLKTRDLLLKYW